MKADTLSLRELFQKDIRYLVPTFQRPYVWDQEKQWEPLWEDVRNTAERYLDELDGVVGDSTDPKIQAKVQEQSARHFLGAVVVQQQPNAAAELETRDVIDGQQRLTTMQLLADAAQRVVDEEGFRLEAKRLRRIVRNNRDFAEGDDEFKLWPTRLDRDAFRTAMGGADDLAKFDESRIVQAHSYFRLQIQEWLGATVDDTERARLVHGLETTLLALLQLVVIDLSTTDDAAVIFETLNARGTPLLASELVKNFVLQEAVGAGLNRDALDRDHWSHLEDNWWRKEIRQGRILRPRLDAFLGYWLTIRNANEVQSHEVFPRFREYVEGSRRPITDVVTDVVRVAEVYRKLETQDELDSNLGRFLYRWHVLEAGVTTPVLLWLFSAEPGILTPAGRERCLTALESFLVRRMICRITTKDYNRLFVEMLSRVQAARSNADDVFVGYLASQGADARRWPDDRELTRAFTELPLYRLLTRGRLRMILAALEESLRGPYAESRHVQPDTLTIEHIMPRSWEKHWPLGPAADPDERSSLVHTIGNLTLLTGQLNTAQSNAGWDTKRIAIGAHSVLYLNKRLLDTYGNGDWDEARIRDRCRTLAAQASTIWPSATEMDN